MLPKQPFQKHFLLMEDDHFGGATTGGRHVIAVDVPSKKGCHCGSMMLSREMSSQVDRMENGGVKVRR